MANKMTLSLIDRLAKEIKKHRQNPTSINGTQYYAFPTVAFRGRIKKDGTLDMRYNMMVWDFTKYKFHIHRRIKSRWVWVTSSVA